MDHPLAPQSTTDWLRAVDAVADVDAMDSIHHPLGAYLEGAASESDAIESSESDRPAQWIRADSSSSSRSTLLSEISAADDAAKQAWSDLAQHCSGQSSSSPKPDSDTAIHSPHSSDEMHWEVLDQAQVAGRTVPKLEPGDEYDFCLEDVQPAPPTDTTTAAAAAAAAQKRPRGRPRKPSIPSSAAATASKAAKARSKTGCTTCRRRKKKCDETKPVCMNCEKNAVVCEGYKEKHVWKSGRERAHDELLKTQPPLDITLQPIFMGMEGREDRLFWNYYRDHVSNVFTAEYNQENAFRAILVPLATNHQAMMHSVLSLASRHMQFDSAPVQKLLRRNTKVTVDSLHVRGSFHNSEALTRLSKGMYNSMNSDDWKVPDALAAQYAQMLFLVLEALAEGRHDGSQRLHYEFFLYMIDRWPPTDRDFYAFISEVFYYHIFADDLLFCPMQKSPRLVIGNWEPTVPLHPPRMLGVADGLFNCLSQITSVRYRVRAGILCGTDPRVDYDSLYRASDIESQIHDWQPEWEAGDSRARATLLYKQMAWLYLKTTISPPPTSYVPYTAYFTMNTADNGALRSETSSRISSPAAAAASAAASHAAHRAMFSSSAKIEAMIPDANNFSNPRRHSIANPSLASGSRPFLPKVVTFAEHVRTVEVATVEEDEDEEGEERVVVKETRNGRVSPPPIRRPPNFELGIDVAVRESLALLESFAANDPCQTLLLVPCVLVGVSCYSPDDQERIRNVIRTVHSYTGLRNTDLALELLNRVWWFMDRGDYLTAWDWQTVAHHLNIQHMF